MSSSITKRYKWESPYDWLLEKSAGWDVKQLRSELMNLAQLVGNDGLQDVFQSDMDKDGYFTPLHVHVKECPSWEGGNLKFEGDADDCPICEEDTEQEETPE